MEREKYKQILQLALASGADDESESRGPQGSIQEQVTITQRDEAANDIFKHTFVDIIDDQPDK